MSNYLVRVELYGAEDDEYEQLHNSMEEIEFDRFIEDSSNNVLKLPNGTYVGTMPDGITPTEIVEAVLTITKDLSPDGEASVFVCQYVDSGASLYPADQ